MGHHHHVLAEGERPFPLFPLLGAGGLVLISLLSVAWLQWFGDPAPDAAARAGAVVSERHLVFADEAGAVLVSDAETGALVQRFETGEQGFLRSTLRGLARARHKIGAGPEVPFHLALHANGQLLLTDPVTGQAIDLWAFGHSNAEVFQTFLGDTPSIERIAAGDAATVAQSATRRASHER